MCRRSVDAEFFLFLFSEFATRFCTALLGLLLTLIRVELDFITLELNNAAIGDSSPMSEMKLKRKLSSIAESKWGRAIVDRQWWEELEAPLGWKLASHCGRSTAEFFTICFGDGV